MLSMLPTVVLFTDATSDVICDVMLATADWAELITCTALLPVATSMDDMHRNIKELERHTAGKQTSKQHHTEEVVVMIKLSIQLAPYFFLQLAACSCPCARMSLHVGIRAW